MHQNIWLLYHKETTVGTINPKASDISSCIFFIKQLFIYNQMISLLLMPESHVARYTNFKRALQEHYKILIARNVLCSDE